MKTFEVQILRGRRDWITNSNWDNPDDALREANNLVETRKFRGVKVVRSRLESNNRFHETTIFRHQRGKAERPEFVRSFQAPVAAEDPPKVERRNELVVVVLCMTVVVHAFLAVLLGFDRAADPARPDKSADAGNVVEYSLPAVTAPVGPGGGLRTVGVALRFRLDGKAKRAEAEPGLAAIVDRVRQALRPLNAAPPQ